MKLKGPYLTLAGGLAVAGVLLSLSATAARKDDIVATASPVGSAARPPADKEAAGEAEQTVEVEPSVEPAPPGTYAGSVKGGDASIAIAIKGDTAIAYVCDGKTAEAWMQGSAENSSLKLKGQGGSTLTAEYANGGLSGTVRASGEKWTFKVKTVKAPSGLYRASRNVRQAKVVGGWIVYNGKQVGMLNTDGIETPAPPIDLTTRTVTIDGTAVQTAPVDGSSLD